MGQNSKMQGRFSPALLTARVGVSPWALALVLLGRLLYYLPLDKPHLVEDSGKYIDTSIKTLLRGDISSGVPPVYGVLIDGLRFFFHDGVLWAVVLVQMALSFAAVLLSMVLIFLRPQFLVYLAILSVFFAASMFFCDGAARRVPAGLLGLCAVCAGLILAYCAAFQRQTGLFSLTDAMPRQNLFLCMYEGYYTRSPDAGFVAAVTDELAKTGGSYTTWNAMETILARYGVPEIAAKTRECLTADLPAYLIGTLNMMSRWADVWLDGYGSVRVEGGPILLHWASRAVQYGFQLFNVQHAVLLPLAEGAYMTFLWLREKRPPWVHIGLFSVGMCTAPLSFFIPCSEYMRTMISVTPYLYLTVTLWIQAALQKWGGIQKTDGNDPKE